MGTRRVIDGWSPQDMQLFKRVWLPISLVACLVQAAFPQCHQVSSGSTNAMSSTTLASATQAEREGRNRTVWLTLKLSKSGAVRDAEVTQGPMTLRAAAIKAARGHKYTHRVTWPDPREMTVMVKFPQDGNGAPEVRQALPAGVSSCVLVAGPPLGYTLPPPGALSPSLNLLLHEPPIMPILAPETEK
jgi:hypothetical protein